jgi:nucleotide sugar dehydrogenase
MDKPRIGFIGQGYVGKNYADDFERRGYDVVRYALEEPYAANKERVKECDIVIVAVPTPTTLAGFDGTAVRDALSLTGAEKTVIIKSTIVPGFTDALQKEFADRVVMFSPEFLSEKTAKEDAEHPIMNVIGITSEAARAAAEAALACFPQARYNAITTAREAEVLKYAHNVNGYFQIILSNILYDLARAHGAEWEPIQRGIEADPYISNRYANPTHKSGRGAGGHCFIKDFAAFADAYAAIGDTTGLAVLRAMERKNQELLAGSGKDIALLESVYGHAASHTHAESR